MKNIKKIALLFSMALTATFGLTACQDDEVLDLPDYPNPEIGVEVEGAGASKVNLSATYDAEGKIQVNGEMTRSYIPQLSAPSIEDRTFKVEPLIVNIPEDQVMISATEFTIKAGMQSPAEPITVTLLDSLYTFTDADKAAKTYQLGLRVIGDEKMEFVDEGEGKVILKKECYTSHFSIQNTGGWPNFEVYHSLYRKKLYGPDLEVKFLIKLDRPALEEITLNPSVALPLDDHRIVHMLEVFPKCVHFSPEAIKIPQGAMQSDTVRLNLDPDFLLLKDERESVRDIMLTAELSAESQWVDSKLSGEPIQLGITKNMYDRNVMVRLVDNPWTYNTEIRRDSENGIITNTDPIKLKIRVQTMGTVFEPVEATVKLEGLPERFMKDSKFSKLQVTIPKGEQYSEEIEWTITDDFLLETADPITYDLKISPELVHPENTDITLYGDSPLQVKIKKVVQFMRWTTLSDLQTMTKLNPETWTVRAISDIFNPNYLFDNDRFLRAEAGWGASSSRMKFVVDMKEVKTVRGIEFWSSNVGQNGSVPEYFEIHVSKDNETWKELGQLNSENQPAGDKYIRTSNPEEARYIRVIADDFLEADGWDWKIKIAEMIVYGE